MLTPDLGPRFDFKAAIEGNADKTDAYIALSSVRAHSVADQLHGEVSAAVNNLFVIPRLVAKLENLAEGERADAAPTLAELANHSKALLELMTQCDAMVEDIKTNPASSVSKEDARGLFERFVELFDKMSVSSLHLQIAVTPEEPMSGGERTEPRYRPLDPNSAADRIHAARHPLSKVFGRPEPGAEFGEGPLQILTETFALLRESINRGKEIASAQIAYLSDWPGSVGMAPQTLVDYLVELGNAFFPGQVERGYIEPGATKRVAVHAPLLARGVCEAVKNSRRIRRDALVRVSLYEDQKSIPSRVLISISDNAGGVPPDRQHLLEERDETGLQKIFTLSGTSTGGGTGLTELASIVRKLNGSIEAHNVPNGGTLPEKPKEPGLNIVILLPHNG